MSNPSEQPDPLEEYLENVELLSALTLKRSELEKHRDTLENNGHNVAALLTSVEEHRGWLRATITEQEKLIDGFLNEAGRHANAGRELFLAVADLVRTVQRLSPEEWAQVPDASRAEWNRLMAQFRPMREEWIRQLTVEERARLHEWGV